MSIVKRFRLWIIDYTNIFKQSLIFSWSEERNTCSFNLSHTIYWSHHQPNTAAIERQNGGDLISCYDMMWCDVHNNVHIYDNIYIKWNIHYTIGHLHSSPHVIGILRVPQMILMEFVKWGKIVFIWRNSCKK